MTNDLTLGERVPNKSEKKVVGEIEKKIVRDSKEFASLVKNTNSKIIFKQEENTDADRMMTVKLSTACDSLADLVSTEWSDKKLRVTEAWDENNEHSNNSLHYEARAVDLTVSDRDKAKLGRLGRLAVQAGFGWVYYERNHIHASVSK